MLPSPFNKLRKAVCMGGSDGNQLVNRERTVCFPQKPANEDEKQQTRSDWADQGKVAFKI